MAQQLPGSGQPAHRADRRRRVLVGPPPAGFQDQPRAAARFTRRSPGLSMADIVYDYYHNDGYSRLHAIFYGQDAELVGAIRSGRLLDQVGAHVPEYLRLRQCG